MLALLKSVDSKAGMAKPKISKSVENALKQGGAKGKTLFEKFKSAKFVGKLGAMMGKLQLKAPIHLIDSMITYAIGVVSGMQDMAQVGMFLFTFFIHAYTGAGFSFATIYHSAKACSKLHRQNPGNDVCGVFSSCE